MAATRGPFLVAPSTGGARAAASLNGSLRVPVLRTGDPALKGGPSVLVSLLRLAGRGRPKPEVLWEEFREAILLSFSEPHPKKAPIQLRCVDGEVKVVEHGQEVVKALQRFSPGFRRRA